MRFARLAAVLVISAIEPAAAKIAGITFDELVRQSDRIIVAQVDGVEEKNGKWSAHGVVVETWKGPIFHSVILDATSTWQCDVSTARRGETAVFFLALGDGPLEYRIMTAGRGRMPLKPIGGRQHAILWPDVFLPEDMPRVAAPESEHSIMKAVSLDVLRERVKLSMKRREY